MGIVLTDNGYETTTLVHPHNQKKKKTHCTYTLSKALTRDGQQKSAGFI